MARRKTHNIGDLISVRIEVDEALKSTPAMQKRKGLPALVLIIESLVEKCLKSAKKSMERYF